MDSFEEIVARFVEVARENAGGIERMLRMMLALFVALFLISGLIQSF